MPVDPGAAQLDSGLVMSHVGWSGGGEREYLVGIAVDVGGPGAAADAVSGFEEEGFEALLC